jgi:hypothetical protein
MFRSKDDKLRDRRKIQDAYTFRGFIDQDEHILSHRQRLTQQLPVLTIHTDVATMINQLQHTVVIHPPRLSYTEMDRELHASSARLLQIQSGKRLSKVYQTSSQPYPLQSVQRVGFMEEMDAIRAPREYVVPQVPRPAQFVFPDAVVSGDPATLTQNELNRFKHSIHEADRERFNESIEDLNRRNRRRSFAIQQQFEDFTKYGMPEARRRAQRSARLSALKEKRSEPWWAQFVGEFRSDGKSEAELWYLDLLTRVPEFTEESMKWLYREALTHRKNGRKFKEMLTRVNELSGALESYKLVMICKAVEEQVHLNSFLNKESGK